MNSIKIATLALVFSAAPAAFAGHMSKAERDGRQDTVDTNYKAAQERCDKLANNAKDICVAEAKGAKDVGSAEVAAAFQPTAKTHYKVHVARAEAAYEVAKERCDDKDGNTKDVCVKEAKAAKVHAIADAKDRMKTWKAAVEANQETATAQNKAVEKMVDSHKDAASDKHDADFAVAKEKCQVLAGAARDACVNEAKTKYSQR